MTSFLRTAAQTVHSMLSPAAAHAAAQTATPTVPTGQDPRYGHLPTCFATYPATPSDTTDRTATAAQSALAQPTSSKPAYSITQPDGSITDYYANGSSTNVQPDGSSTSCFGSKGSMHYRADGSRAQHDSDDNVVYDTRASAYQPPTRLTTSLTRSPPASLTDITNSGSLETTRVEIHNGLTTTYFSDDSYTVKTPDMRTTYYTQDKSIIGEYDSAGNLISNTPTSTTTHVPWATLPSFSSSSPSHHTTGYSPTSGNPTYNPGADLPPSYSHPPVPFHGDAVWDEDSGCFLDTIPTRDKGNAEYDDFGLPIPPDDRGASSASRTASPTPLAHRTVTPGGTPTVDPTKVSKAAHGALNGAELGLRQVKGVKRVTSTEFQYRGKTVNLQFKYNGRAVALEEKRSKELGGQTRAMLTEGIGLHKLEAELRTETEKYNRPGSISDGKKLRALTKKVQIAKTMTRFDISVNKGKVEFTVYGKGGDFTFTLDENKIIPGSGETPTFKVADHIEELKENIEFVLQTDPQFAQEVGYSPGKIKNRGMMPQSPGLPPGLAHLGGNPAHTPRPVPAPRPRSESSSSSYDPYGHIPKRRSGGRSEEDDLAARRAALEKAVPGGTRRSHPSVVPPPSATDVDDLDGRLEALYRESRGGHSRVANEMPDHTGLI